MSFMLTTDQIRARKKFVTRRMGWKNLKFGDKLYAVEKCMGLKKGEKIVRLQPFPLQVIASRWESLSMLVENIDYGIFEMNLEGFPDMDPADFIALFLHTHKGATPKSLVHRIQFIYLDGP